MIAEANVVEDDFTNHKQMSMKRAKARFGFTDTSRTLKKTGIAGLKTKRFGYKDPMVYRSNVSDVKERLDTEF